MPRQKLPAVHFETGILVKRRVPKFCGSDLRQRDDYCVIGKLEDGTPFFLSYSDALTSWWCPVTLGDSLRKKILNLLRQDIRFADQLPAYITVHSVEKIDEKDLGAGSAAAYAITGPFFDDVWLEQYLGEKKKEYIDLAVPFAEKDTAKSLGAIWDPARKVWTAEKVDDMSPFAKWMPAA